MRAATIKKAAAMPDVPLTESALRGMVKRKECPGWYTGSRFVVNIDALLAMLEQKSMEAVNGGGNSFSR